MNAIRRSAALITIGGVLVAATIADFTVKTDTSAARVRREQVPVLPAALAAKAPRASAWYCASGTAGGDTAGQLTVRITNVRQAPASARLRVTGGDTETDRAVEIAPGAAMEFKIGDLVTTATPGVIVEVSTGSVVVDEWVDGSNDAAWSTCATRPSPSWYLPGGTAEIGTVSHLALFNPFSESAIVKVLFQTDVGLREPFDLQSFVVPPRSRADIKIDEVLGNPTLAAAVVQARTGRIIAQRYEVLTDTLRGTGVTLGSGNIAVNDSLSIAFPGRQGSDQLLAAVSNVSDRDATVTVTVHQPGSVSTTLKPVKVAAQHAKEIELTGSVSLDAPALITVKSTELIAADLRWWEMNADGTKVEPGVVVLPFAPTGSKEWFMPVRSPNEGTTIVVSNDHAVRAHLRLTTISADGEKRLESINVPAHSVITVPQASIAAGVTALRVQSSVPVVVVASQRTAAAEGVVGALSATVGVPVD